jgi:hypothetical protein
MARQRTRRDSNTSMNTNTNMDRKQVSAGNNGTQAKHRNMLCNLPLLTGQSTKNEVLLLQRLDQKKEQKNN